MRNPLADIGYMNPENQQTRGRTDRRRWGQVLIGSLFLAAGLGMFLLLVAPAMIDAVQMRYWIETRATIDSVELVQNEETARVDARYRYEIDGVSYSGTRVGIHSGSDSLGDFQQELGRRLLRAQQTNEPVIAWFDPDDPARAVLDRSVRPGLLVFLSVFALLFGGAGAAVVASGWRRMLLVDDTAFESRPWQQRKAWSGEPITSSARMAALMSAGFAAFWNLFSWGMLALLYESILEEGVAVLAVMLLFPLAGAGIAAFAVQAVREWRRHGATPLTLTPFPGALDGSVAGELVLGSSVPTDTPVTLTLSVIRHYRSGKNSREKVLDQWSQTVTTEAGLDGPTARFNFTTPSGLPSSDAAQTRERHAWYLAVDAERIGLSRRFEVPVYPDTGSHTGVARKIDARRAGKSIEQSWSDPLPAVSAEGSRAIEWHYGLFHHKIGAVFGTVMAAAFVAVAVHVSREDMVFAGFFGGFSALILFACVAALGSSRQVRFSTEGLDVRHRWFGIPIRRRSVAIADIERFDCKRSGSETGQSGPVVFYRVVAHALDKSKINVAWRIKGKETAEALVAGLDARHRRTA